MLPDTLIEERELLAEVKARPEWADLPIVKIIARDTLGHYGDPMWQVQVVYNGPRLAGFNLHELVDRPKDADPAKYALWDRLSQARDYVKRKFSALYPDHLAMVHLTYIDAIEA